MRTNDYENGGLMLALSRILGVLLGVQPRAHVPVLLTSRRWPAARRRTTRRM